MSFHSGQTFTFGETPSATKWNYLWENDYALADGTGISNDAIITRHILAANVTAPKIGYSSIAKGEYFNNSPSFSTSSTSFTDMSGASISLTKGSANSAILVTFSTANYTGATGHTTEFGVRAGGTDYSICKRYHDTLTTFPLSGSRIITGLAAGAQTIQARFKSNTSSTNVIDGNGFVGMTAIEI